jgi:ABC-type glucose/galactose transport system permease subunit
MGVMYELDASRHRRNGLSGGIGRITGTVVSTTILGIVPSGFTCASTLITNRSSKE